MIIRNQSFNTGTHIMAILNLTPDSFNENSRCDERTILARVEQAISDGAEVIDLGAQSTRPGHIQITADEEINRLLKPLKMVRSHFDIPISIDTFYSSVAKVTLDNGADLINDIWGLQYGDKTMANVIGEYNASVCIMHNSLQSQYLDFYGEILAFLNKSLEIAKASKIVPDKIILDGGIGFGKTYDQNWDLLNNYDKLKVLGFPLLLGTSRKSMFGGTVSSRLEPTLESTKLAVTKDVLFVRVHDIKENKGAIMEAYGNLHRN